MIYAAAIIESACTRQLLARPEKKIHDGGSGGEHRDGLAAGRRKSFLKCLLLKHYSGG